ncbi:MAG: response regulator [Planctomycetota bacterium]
MNAPGILIVEDERIVAIDLEQQLRRLGYRVVGRSANAKDAIRLVEEMSPRLVLMDIHLPGESDGIDAAKTIRHRFDVPVVYLTAHSDEQTLQRALATEPFGYIVKPFHERELRTTLEVAFYKHDMEQKLREREEWIAALLRSVGDAVVATDENNAVVFLNVAAESLLGWKVEEVKGRPVEEVLWLADEATRARQFFEDLDRPGGGPFSKSLLLRHRQGTELPVEPSLAPIRNRAGTVVGRVLVLRDVSARRALEERAWQTQKLEAVGRLAGGVAHDFNNIMTIILGYSEIALQDLVDNPPAKESIEHIKDAGMRAANLTQQLLAFGRKQVLAPALVNFNDLIRDMMNILRRLLGENVELTIVADPKLDPVRVDPSQFRQVVVNLAINAKDSMPNGGKLTIVTSNVGVGESLVPRDNPLFQLPTVLMAISDSGVGIDEETQKKLFEPFFTTKTDPTGAGLGLASVYGIVRQSGGHIEVHSEVGVGTSFQIYLPAVRTDGTTKPSQFQADSSEKPETVLVVEDEAVVRKLTRKILESKGYRVLEADDANNALEVADRHQGAIDLLLTDVIMPGGNGKELSELLSNRRPTIRTLFMSGYTDDVLSQEGVGHYEARFIQKPFTAAGLLVKVREMLASDGAP